MSRPSSGRLFDCCVAAALISCVSSVSVAAHLSPSQQDSADASHGIVNFVQPAAPLAPWFGTEQEACCQCIHVGGTFVNGSYTKTPPNIADDCYVFPCVIGPELPWPDIGNYMDRMCYEIIPAGKDERYAKELYEYEAAKNRSDAAWAFSLKEALTPFEERAKAAKAAAEKAQAVTDQQEREMKKAKTQAEKKSCGQKFWNYPGCCTEKAAADNTCMEQGTKGERAPLYTYRWDESVQTAPYGYFDPIMQSARDKKENAGRHMVRLNPDRKKLTEETRYQWDKTMDVHKLPPNSAKPGVYGPKFDERAQSGWNKDAMSAELQDFLNGKDTALNAHLFQTQQKH